MEDIIETFMDYTSAYESPGDFFRWSCIAGIGAVMRNNCCLMLGDTKVFPNIYVIIVANPAMRKAKPLNSIIELVKSAKNTKVIEGRTSIQAVIQRLGEIEKNRDGSSITGASGIVFSEELSAMFTEDDANIPVITDLYDYKSTYTSALVTRGTTRLTDVVVTLLGASNEELLKPVFNNRAIYGGLLSRCLIVYGDKVRHRNSLMFEDPKKYDPLPLQKMFKEIAQLKGTFHIPKETRIHYDKWYHDVCPALDNKGMSKTGAEGRIHITVLKVAMILAVSKYRKLEISTQVLDESIERCTSLFVNYKRLTLGSGRSKSAEPSVLVLKLLWESEGYTLTRRLLLQKAWGDVSSDELNQVIPTLLEAGLITQVDRSGSTVYTLTKTSIDYFSQK